MAKRNLGAQQGNSEALRQRYLAERDKRLRQDGDAQYIEAIGDFGEFADDPYVETGFSRSPVVRDFDVLVVGAGFGGILTGAELIKTGIESFLIVDRAGDFGGTWYWNRYPGVRCDIEAAIYMPLIEEVGTVPTERYATGNEILEHARAMARHFNLYERAMFQTKVEELVWDEGLGRWIARTDRGDLLRSRFVSVSQGPLAKVKLPGIPGIRDFKGRMFHSARWDYEYTGGTSAGGLVKLRDKTVAVIGTGATAIQIVPQLAEHAQKVLIFQRTPSVIDIRDNRKTDPAWFASQPAGWQRRRMRNFLEVVSGKQVDEYHIGDHWGDLWVRFNELMRDHFAPGGEVSIETLMQRADDEKMERVRKRIISEVSDPALAERLLPWYRFLCKRPLYSDDFLPVFNRPNVELIDTDGRGVQRITDEGLIANDIHHTADCIVLATGFDVGAPPYKVGQYSVTGRNGVSLKEKWQGQLRTLHGTQLHGFPNFHIVGGTAQGTTTFNFTHTLMMQAEHAVAIIGHCIKSELHSYEVTAEAEERWHALLEKKHVNHDRFYEECTPGFMNNEGNFRERPTYVGGGYGGGALEYEQLIADWRANDMITDAHVIAKSCGDSGT